MNIKNGDLAIQDKSFTIGRGLIKTDFVQSKLYDEVINEKSYGFTFYNLNSQLISNEWFDITLYFNNKDILNLVNISLSNEGDIASWNNWSENEQIKKKDMHDKWLKKNIGNPPYKYDWGEISSSYDPRSGSSMITIKYNV